MRRPSVGCHTSYREGGQGHEVFPEKFFPRSLEPLLRGGRTCTSTPGTWASGHSSVCAAGHLRTCAPGHLRTRGLGAREIRAPAHLCPRPARHPHLARSHALPRDRTDQTEVAPGGPRSYRHARTRPESARRSRYVRPRHHRYDLEIRRATSSPQGRGLGQARAAERTPSHLAARDQGAPARRRTVQAQVVRPRGLPATPSLVGPVV